ncbi:hypothetical protein G3Q07_003903 [Shigella sonnei]|nr:hypothetical protein [Shigella sonnei]EFP9211123.1 hypothetical protein [Shigella sonnei]EFP9367594.1 hypothetical protein [Shigella sonnei]EFP9398179.1 hypothetical protein [Shigella sonnei]EFP9436282.1 hypothetical protein [Shigella sonnei]
MEMYRFLKEKNNIPFYYVPNLIILIYIGINRKIHQEKSNADIKHN